MNLLSGDYSRSPVSRFAVACVATLLQTTLPAQAEPNDVYRWVDESGIVHYSQWPPRQAVAAVSTLTLQPTNAPDYRPDDYRYSVRNQAERIAATWDALRQEKEAQEAERRLARAEARLAELEAQASAAEPAYAHRYFSPFRPLHHFRPIHFGGFHDRHPHRPPRHRPAGGDERPAAGARPGFRLVQPSTTTVKPGFAAGRP